VVIWENSFRCRDSFEAHVPLTAWDEPVGRQGRLRSAQGSDARESAAQAAMAAERTTNVTE